MTVLSAPGKGAELVFRQGRIGVVIKVAAIYHHRPRLRQDVMDCQHPLGDHGLHNAQQAGALLDFMEVVVGVAGPEALVFGKLSVKIPVQPDALLAGAVECLKNLAAVDVPHGIENAEAHGNGIVFQIDPELDIGHAVGGLHKFIYGGAVVQQV